MANTQDRGDYFRPNEWKDQYPNNGSRFVYFTYKLTYKANYWRDNPPHTEQSITTRSYYLKAPIDSILINKGYKLYEVVGVGTETEHILRAEGTLPDTPNFPDVESGYITEYDETLKEFSLYNNDHIIKTLTITDAGFAQYCSSTSADESEERSLHTAFSFQSGTITFDAGENGFHTEFNSDGSIKKITGVCKGVYKDVELGDYLYEDPESFNAEYSMFYHSPDDPDNPPNPFRTWDYEITANFYNDYEEQEGGQTIVHDCPQLYEIIIPSGDAWIRDDDGLLTLSNKLPKQLEWARPYPYGKWYRDSNGELRTRGLPEILVDTQGAFNECPNLIYVKIPESVKSIGRYAFRDTNLKSVKIANDCTYYPTSFPIGCKIYFYGGGSPAMTDIRSLEGYTIGELETKTINEMEGN